MPNLCKHSGKTRLEYSEKCLEISTLFTAISKKIFSIPQKYSFLHNFYTHKSTVFGSDLTDSKVTLSTVSTDTITTTTIKYKER